MKLWQRVTGRSASTPARSGSDGASAAATSESRAARLGALEHAAAPQPAGQQPVLPGAGRPAVAVQPVQEIPTIRLGMYAWACIGVVIVLVAGGYVIGALAVLFIPFVLALFPAAVLVPPAQWLKRSGVPASLAALVCMVAFFGVLTGVIAALAPMVSQELEGLQESVQQGIEQLDAFLQQGRFGLPAISVEELIQRGREQFGSVVTGGGLGSQALSAATVIAESVAGLLLGLVALFFYLKDGSRLAAGLRDTLPRRFRYDAQQVGDRVWFTIGAYIRGQLIIALVDALLIGIGLWILGVSLFLPLAVLTFFGGLFPIVGALLAGFVAAVVALATNGFTTALLVVALIVVVQQVEGDVLAPVVLGKATQLHPLAVLAALTAGAVLLGVLGAFLAVPVAASVARATSYLRERAPG